MTSAAQENYEFSENHDGRYLITLTGICRFRVAEELPLRDGYRSIKADWSDFKEDIKARTCLDLDRARLRGLLRQYFDKEGMDCDWDAVDNAPDGKLITCLVDGLPLRPLRETGAFRGRVLSRPRCPVYEHAGNGCARA